MSTAVRIAPEGSDNRIGAIHRIPLFHDDEMLVKNVPKEAYEKFNFDPKNAWFLHADASKRRQNKKSLNNPLSPPKVNTREITKLEESRYIVESEQIHGRNIYEGLVYRAWDTHLNRIVAIKVMKKYEYTGSMTELEALSLAKINHSNIPQVYDFISQAETPQGKAECMVMQYIEGQSVQNIIEATKNGEASPSVSRILKIIKSSSEAISHLWTRHEILSRDVKPGNIMERESDGHIYFIDLGISNWVREIKGPDDFIGTYEYMAPEVMTDAQAGTIKSEEYSLAIVAYELLTGHWPYADLSEITDPSIDATDPIVKVKFVMENKAKSLFEFKSLKSCFKPETISKLEQVFIKALNKDPDLRYPSPMQFSRELEIALQDEDLTKSIHY